MSTADSARSGHGEFGSLLRTLRTRAGLSQEELAHLAGVSVRALADMERGRTRGPQRRTVGA
ncbi:helix-turn-helix transcriptional regulator, partial [Streptomyces sp. SR27]|uniref:helix-turn-helix domain-containing protein n=1 Tax=Streptomyces sp. SR27 TaxID=3076630 RepID=UPI00295AD291